MKKLFNDRQEAEIVSLYEDGLSSPKIARLYECSTHAVIDVLHKHTRMRKYTDKFGPELTARIADMYSVDGRSSIQIADTLGMCNDQSILNLLQRQGITPRAFNDPTYRDYAVDEHFFDEIDTEEKAYWLGFITADGCIGVDEKNGDYSVRISLQAGDEAHLHKFRNAISGNMPIATNERMNKGQLRSKSTIAVHSRMMVDALSRLGLHPRKSLTVRACRSVPSCLSRHYWRGLVDGDGTLWVNDDERSYSVGLCGTEDVCRQFQEFISATVPTDAQVRPNSTIYSITFGGIRKAKAIASILYNGANVCLDRKWDAYQTLMTREACNSDTSGIGVDELSSWFEQYGNWKNVSRVTGISTKALIGRRRKAGLSISEHQKCISRERVEASYSKCGMWKLVEDDLDVSESWLWRKRHEWGMIPSG